MAVKVNRCPVCGAPMESGSRKCEFCGNEVSTLLRSGYNTVDLSMEESAVKLLKVYELYTELYRQVGICGDCEYVMADKESCAGCDKCGLLLECSQDEILEYDSDHAVIYVASDIDNSLLSVLSRSPYGLILTIFLNNSYMVEKFRSDEFRRIFVRQNKSRYTGSMGYFSSCAQRVYEYDSHSYDYEKMSRISTYFVRKIAGLQDDQIRVMDSEWNEYDDSCAKRRNPSRKNPGWPIVRNPSDIEKQPPKIYSPLEDHCLDEGSAKHKNFGCIFLLVSVVIACFRICST